MGEPHLSGRTIVVFGGVGALGDAVVERLAADGASVVAADVESPPEERRRAGVTYAAVDALDETSVAAVIAGVAGPLWGVVNVIGGYTAGSPLAELDLDTLRQQLDVNLITAAVVTKVTIASLTAGGIGGRLVHTSSRVATTDGKNSFAYSVSKLAVVRLVEAAAAEVRELGISVNCIMPSVIDTPANRAAMPSSDHDRWPKPHELAAVMSFLVSDDAGVVSGAAIPVYGRA